MSAKTITLRRVAKRKWFRDRALAAMMRMQLAMMASDHERQLAALRALAMPDAGPVEVARVH